ncbi:MAG TPA: hypothetical protein VK509_21940 [Polyangiales bacterium]|nr:hypothetical protein [Polyangiales bacterium]
MKRFLLGASLLACLALATSACGDDDDDGGGGCANAQMVCERDGQDVIDCANFDSAPASIKDCAGKATSCAAVLNCLTGGGAGGGG